MRRRAYLGAMATVATVLAGCIGGGNSGDSSSGESGGSSDDGAETSGGSDDGADGGSGDGAESNEDGGDGDEDAIRTAVRTYFDAFDAGNYYDIIDVMHSEGPEIGEIRSVGELQIEQLGERYSLEMREMTVTQQTDDTATVEVRYTRSSASGDEDVTKTIELRRADGEWLIWSERP